MIKIVTDSTAYMINEYVREHDVKIVPLTIITNYHSYPEGAPGSFDELFESMLRDGDTSKSSMPAPESFKEAFQDIIDKGDEVICITISSSLSGTYNSACLAKKMCDESKITLVDSGSAGQQMLLCVEEAVELAEKGFSREEIEVKLAETIARSYEVFVPLTLKHLIRGGRIGGVSAVVGSLLHVKPLLCFNNGVLICKKKIIGMNKAIREIISEIPKTVKKIYVMKIYKSDFFNSLFEKVKELFPDINVRKAEVGPVIGVHVGPGTIGIAYC